MKLLQLLKMLPKRLLPNHCQRKVLLLDYSLYHRRLPKVEHPVKLLCDLPNESKLWPEKMPAMKTKKMTFKSWKIVPKHQGRLYWRFSHSTLMLSFASLLTLTWSSAKFAKRFAVLYLYTFYFVKKCLNNYQKIFRLLVVLLNQKMKRTTRKILFVLSSVYFR